MLLILKLNAFILNLCLIRNFFIIKHFNLTISKRTKHKKVVQSFKKYLIPIKWTSFHILDYF